MLYLQRLLSDLWADPDVSVTRPCSVHRHPHASCMACMVNAVERWDAGLARLIYLVVRDGDEVTPDVLWDYLSDRGLEHHWQEIMDDAQQYVHQGGTLRGL